MIPASDTFVKALKSPIKQVYLKLELYDNSMKFIKEITTKVTRDSIGSISVDADRDIRRSFSFTLDNQNNEFDWGENYSIWIDKRVKLFIGLKTLMGVEYIPQGLFILSEPTDSHGFNGKITSLTGQDKAYLFTGNRGKFLNQTTIATGTKITDALKIIAQANGETLFNFDPITATVPYELTYEASSNRWEAMKMLALLGQCEIFYDVNGYLRLREIDLNQINNYSPVWSYKYGDPSERFYAGNVRSMDEQNLSNHIVVLGGGSDTAVARYELKVSQTNPLWVDSPYAVERIGDILYAHNNGNPDPLLSTNDECKWRAKYELMNRLGYTERISMQISPNYLHDASDVIEVQDSQNNVSGKYLLRSFSLPLNPSLMRCECYKERKVINDWNFI
jgi:hypothetical protein